MFTGTIGPPLQHNTTSAMSYYGNAENSGPGSNMDAGKIFVGGLSWQTTEETLRYHFEQYGEVSSVEVMRDRNTGDPRGFAFVVFKSDETVELIMNSGPHEINNKIVDVKRAQARGVAPPSIHGGDVSLNKNDHEIICRILILIMRSCS